MVQEACLSLVGMKIELVCLCFGPIYQNLFNLTITNTAASIVTMPKLHSFEMFFFVVVLLQETQPDVPHIRSR